MVKVVTGGLVEKRDELGSSARAGGLTSDEGWWDEWRQIEIPPTDHEHYITGLYALNVLAPEGTSGDWHDVFH
ncbi:hypothetical protein [Actinomyces oricola]